MKKVRIVLLWIGFLVLFLSIGAASGYLYQYKIKNKLELSFYNQIDTYFGVEESVFGGIAYWPKGELLNESFVSERIRLDTTSMIQDKWTEVKGYHMCYVLESGGFEFYQLKRYAKDAFEYKVTYGGDIGLKTPQRGKKVVGSYYIDGGSKTDIYQDVLNYSIEDVRRLYQDALNYLFENNGVLNRNEDDLLSFRGIKNKYYKIKKGLNENSASKWHFGEFSTMDLASVTRHGSSLGTDVADIYTHYSEESLVVDFQSEVYKKDLYEVLKYSLLGASILYLLVAVLVFVFYKRN